MQVAKDQNPLRWAFDWLRLDIIRHGGPLGALRAALTIHPSETLPFANSLRRFAMCSAGASLAALCVAPVPALAENGQQMNYADARSLTPADALVGLIWSDAIASQNAFVRETLKQPLAANQNAMLDIISKDFPFHQEALVVTIASTRSCEAGANNAASEIEPSVCELRIARIKDGKIMSIQKGSGCYIDHHDPDLPAKNRNDNTLVSFDPETRIVRLETIVAGHVVAHCNRTIAVK